MDAIITHGDSVNGQSIVIAEACKTFEQIKIEILERAEQNRACEDGYEAAEATETLEELLRVIKDNIAWCTRTKTIDANYLESNFGKELLRKYGIYTSGAHDISVDNIVEIILLGSASATVEALGSASATVEARDSASATVKALGSASATVEAWGSASATVEAWDSASATVKAWGSASATVKAWGSASATVKAWDSASATIGQYHSSNLKYSLGDGACPLIKHITERKIYVKTSDFEIVQVKN